MAVERTLSIVKPDAVAKNAIGQIYSRFEQAGLNIVAARMRYLSQKEAEGFYAVHRERPFFRPLVRFITPPAKLAQRLHPPNSVPSCAPPPSHALVPTPYSRTAPAAPQLAPLR